MEFPYGPLVDAVPSDYVVRQQWPEYDAAAQLPAPLKPRPTAAPYPGVRWGLWPLFSEAYVGDDEPQPLLSEAGPHRLVFWQRINRHDIPPGWHQWSRSTPRVEGFAHLGEGDHTALWSESARRYTHKWHTQHLGKTHTIEPVSFAEFAAAYRHSSVAKKAHDYQLDIIKRMLANHACASHMQLWGARDTTTKELVAGLAVANSPTYRSSYYQAGFILPKAHVPAMEGLIDHWFRYAKHDGLVWLMFGGFWHPGKSKKVWGGFSAFKAKFGLSYIAYPPELWRFKKDQWHLYP